MELINDLEQIIQLEKELEDIKPKYKELKIKYDRISKEFHEMLIIVNAIKNEIKEIQKKRRTENVKEKVGKGTLMSFRKFFDEVKNGKTFDNKTMVWSSKDGKSGAVVRIGMENKLVKFKSKWDSMSRAVSPAEIIRAMNDYPSLSFDEFQFNLYYMASLVSGKEYFTGPNYRTIEDVMIFICDKVTLADFKDVTKTKDMIFFVHLPSLGRSTGELRDGYLWLSYGGIPKKHYERNILYPLKAKVLR